MKWYKQGSVTIPAFYMLIRESDSICKSKRSVELVLIVRFYWTN